MSYFDKQIMMEEFSIAERILRKILGPISTEGCKIMKFINILQKIQTLLVKEKLFFYRHLQRMKVINPLEEFSNTLEDGKLY